MQHFLLMSIESHRVFIDLTTTMLTAPCLLAYVMLKVDTTSSNIGSPLSASSKIRNPKSLPSNFSILTFPSFNVIVSAAFKESSHYFSRLRFLRIKRNKILSNVEDQTMLQPQSILRKSGY